MEYLGYKYSRSVRNKTGTTLYYKCTEKARFTCKGSAKKTCDGRVKIIRYHNHPTNVLNMHENSEINPRLIEWYQLKKSLNRETTSPQVNPDESNNTNNDAVQSVKVSIPLVSLQFDIPIVNQNSDSNSDLTSNMMPQLKSNDETFNPAPVQGPMPCPIVKDKSIPLVSLKFDIPIFNQNFDSKSDPTSDLVAQSISNETSHPAPVQKPMPCPTVTDEPQELFSANKIFSGRVPRPSVIQLHTTVIQAENKPQDLDKDSSDQSPVNHQQSPEQDQPIDLSMKTAKTADTANSF